MKTFTAIVLAASFAAVPAAHAVKKPPLAEVHGVKLDSICTACGVVSDVSAQPVKGKGGSEHGAASGVSASGASAGGAVDKKAKTVWSTTVTFKSGTTQTYQQTRNPGLQPGDVVTIDAGRPTKYVK